MALDDTVLSALIDTNLAVDPNYSDWAQRATFKAQLIDAIAKAVVEHIQTSGVVNVTGTTASACTAGGSTGTCTAAGTMT